MHHYGFLNANDVFELEAGITQTLRCVFRFTKDSNDDIWSFNFRRFVRFTRKAQTWIFSLIYPIIQLTTKLISQIIQIDAMVEYELGCLGHVLKILKNFLNWTETCSW